MKPHERIYAMKEIAKALKEEGICGDYSAPFAAHLAVEYAEAIAQREWDRGYRSGRRDTLPG